MIVEGLQILSPKRNRRLLQGWEGFFPYYAGYSEAFARNILENVELRPDAVVLDPWNGSGTTTFTAAQLGYRAIGLDLNPVMVIVSRARTLPFSEIDALEPLAKAIIDRATSSDNSRARSSPPDSPEPLLSWFDRDTCAVVRSMERSIREQLVGSLTLSETGPNLKKFSSIAAAFYVALFAVCRELTASFQSSNPTWLKKAKADELHVSASRSDIENRFLSHIGAMAAVLSSQDEVRHQDQSPIEIRVADSTSPNLRRRSVDLVLTSPPYCTRIDYTAATRVELAVISPMLMSDQVELGRRMIGSTRVPKNAIEVDKSWGPTCRKFLHSVKTHPSKASGGYYFQTHLDYFDKMSKSINAISRTLKKKASAVFVVQDSYYKDVHNDLPTILTEIAVRSGLTFKRREDFYLRRSMSGINRNSKTYDRKPGAVESVLCFQK
jgi:hypothetical protein